MKIKYLNLDYLQIIAAYLAGEKNADRLLYEQFAPAMLGICRRYIRDDHRAEDAMIQGFFKAFKNLHKLEAHSRFPSWIKKIMVNECLMQLRSAKTKMVVDNELALEFHSENPAILNRLAFEDIIVLLDKLPNGYRTVFNMYVIEGYKHREIAEALEISINTSKSQLIMARKKLKELIANNLSITERQQSKKQK